MDLPKKALKQLQNILEKDYGRKVSEEVANELGTSLLRLTRIGLAALARTKKDGK